jgi:ELWxxDGT repeat protein
LCFVSIVQISHAQQQVWNLDGGYQIRNSISIKGKIIYLASALAQTQLYATTTNQDGAALLGDFSEAGKLTTFGDKVIFIGRKDYDINIWITDGTTQGTISLTSFQHADINDIVVFNNKAYFTNGNSIYYTDGTIQGTQLLLTVPVNTGAIPPFYPILFLKAVQDKLIYYYYGQLGVTDGTSSAIEFLSDNNATPITQAYITASVVNNKLFFINASKDIGYELWSTDGTDANTKLLKDINVGQASGFETVNHDLMPWFTASNGKLYFVANKGTGNSVWVTDGTLGGTNELYIGSYTPNPVSLKSIDGNIYFSNNYNNGFYFSDGLNNTVQNIGGTQNPSDAYSFIKFDGSVYFVASNSDYGYELWKTNNTPESTLRVTDICEGSCSAFNHYTGLTACENTLFFSASTIANGLDAYGNLQMANYQLWKLTGNSTTTAIQKAVIEKISYYPNPCKDYVTVAFQQPVSNVQLFSVLGNEIKVDWHQDQNKLIIHTQELSSGMYTLLINGNQSIKIIKE